MSPKNGFNSITDSDHSDPDLKYALPISYPFSILVPEMQRSLFMMITSIVGFAAKNPLLINIGEKACAALQRAYESIAAVLTNELYRAGHDTPLVKAAQISIDAASLSFAGECMYVYIWVYEYMCIISYLIEAMLLGYAYTERGSCVLKRLREA